MTRNLKALGLALLATFAMSAIAASASSAATDVLTAGSYPAYLTGDQSHGKHSFAIGGKNVVECETADFSGQVAEDTSEVTITPVYEGNCTLEESTAVDVTENGCDYLFDGDTDGNGHAAVNVDCNHESSITIADPSNLCVIHIGDTHTNSEATVNQGLRGVSYTTINDNGTNAITVDITVKGIAYEATNFCGLLGIPSTGTNGEYSGSTILRAYSDEAHTKQISLTDHEVE